MSEEIMSVSSSGAMKGTKLARHDLIPAEGINEVAEHFGRTANKYPPNNWRAGYEWSKSYAALQRHAIAWWSGEDRDPELDSPHLAAVAWHALTLLTFAQTHPEFDDRYVAPEPVEPYVPPGPIKTELGRAVESGEIQPIELEHGVVVGTSPYDWPAVGWTDETIVLDLVGVLPETMDLLTGRAPQPSEVKWGPLPDGDIEAYQAALNEAFERVARFVAGPHGTEDRLEDLMVVEWSDSVPPTAASRTPPPPIDEIAVANPVRSQINEQINRR